MNLKRMLVWTASLALLLTPTESVRTDLVRLIDFDVRIALNLPDTPVNDLDFNLALKDVVTAWMNDIFESKSLSQGLIGNQTTFQTVALTLTEADRRQLDEEQDTWLVTATFTGVSLWERQGEDTIPIATELVEIIQRSTLLEDILLLNSLQAANAASGLGFYVNDARADINTATLDPTLETATTDDSTDNLEIIIIIAIVVACLAFGLLMFAVLWAWKTDRQKEEAYKVDAPKVLRTPDGTGSTSDYEQQQPKVSPHREQQQLPPSEIQPQAYPESVISEDISQSLTAYYRSGMAGYNVPRRELNDAASMSSMDSYGYSLDGYAPSLSGGPTQMGYPVGPLNGQVKDPGFDTDADPEDTDAEEEAPVARQEEPIGDKV
jgi:hypothetical protein